MTLQWKPIRHQLQSVVKKVKRESQDFDKLKFGYTI